MKDIKDKLKDKMIIQQSRCDEWIREVLYCRAYKCEVCPLTCTYAKQELKTEDYKVGMK